MLFKVRVSSFKDWGGNPYLEAHTGAYFFYDAEKFSNEISQMWDLWEDYKDVWISCEATLQDVRIWGSPLKFLVITEILSISSNPETLQQEKSA